MKKVNRFRLPAILALACALALASAVPSGAAQTDTVQGTVPTAETVTGEIPGAASTGPAAETQDKNQAGGVVPGGSSGMVSADPAAGTAPETDEPGQPGDSADSTGKKKHPKIKLDAPEVTSVSVLDRRSIRVSWDKAAKADRYEVFIDGKSVGDTKKKSFIYQSKKLVWGEKYKVAVRAYAKKNGETFYSAKSGKVSFRMIPGTVKIKSAEAKDYHTIEVTWEKAAGADGYMVYRRTGDGKLKKMAEVKGEKTLRYTDETVKLGQTYKYLVRAYWQKDSLIQTGRADGKEKAAKTSLQVPELEAVSYSMKAVNVRWKEVSGAQGYMIYRKDKKEDDFKRVAVVRDGSVVSWQDTKITEGKKYYYTVQAYRKSDDHTYKSGMDEKGVTGILRIESKTVTVKDKKSALYGKKVRLYCHSDGTQLQNVESIVGSRSRYLLYVNKTRNQVTVYAVDGDVYIPVKAFICSTGAWAGATPSGTFHTQQKMRWHELMGPCWGQWCTRIHGGVLFHSVYYNSYNNNNNLSVSAYNRLGSAVSHGCVRLTSGDAKWIYDHCSVGTTVRIYSGSGYEPMEKPTAYKLSYWHTWDPTDPNMRYKCEQRGCH